MSEEKKDPQKFYCPLCMEELTVSEKYWDAPEQRTKRVRARVLHILGDCCYCEITVSMELEFLEDYEVQD